MSWVGYHLVVEIVIRLLTSSISRSFLVSAASGEIGELLDYANPSLSHKKNERCSKRNDSSSIKRIVTEGGVDFEMTPLPVVWNHGSYKTQY